MHLSVSMNHEYSMWCPWSHMHSNQRSQDQCINRFHANTVWLFQSKYREENGFVICRKFCLFWSWEPLAWQTNWYFLFLPFNFLWKGGYQHLLKCTWGYYFLCIPHLFLFIRSLGYCFWNCNQHVPLLNSIYGPSWTLCSLYRNDYVNIQ